MPPDQAQGSIINFVIPYSLIFLVIYFLIIKPQKDKQRNLKKMLSNVKKNDEIITNSGIHGTVVNVKESTVIIRIDDNAKMEIDKDVIATIMNKNA